MFLFVLCLPDKILPSTPFPVLDQGLNLVLGFTFDLQWLLGFSGAFTWHIGPQLGHVEHVVNTSEATLQVKLVFSLAYTLEDLEMAYKLLTKLVYSCQMQFSGVQQHPLPNFMLLVPVMAINVPILLLLDLQ